MIILALLFSLLHPPLAANATLTASLAASNERPIGGVAVSAAPFSNGDPSVASDGSDFFVVWRDGRDGSAILASRIAHDGTILQSGIEIARGPAVGYPNVYAPQVLWSGSAYVVIWKSMQRDENFTQQIWVARYDREGAPLQAPYMLVEKTRGLHTVAFNGSRFIVAYVHEFGMRPRAWILDQNGYPAKALLLADVEVSTSATMSAAARGSDFLVVWDNVWENERQGFVIQGVPVHENGDVEGGARIFSQGGHPVVASDGTSYLLLYATQFGSFSTPWVSRILSGDLSAVSTEREMPNLGRPAVLWRGDRYLAMGRSLGMIDREGNSIPGPAPLVTGGEISGYVSAAVNTSPRTLVTWTSRTRDGYAAMARLYEGQPPAASTPEFVISTSANRQIDPDIVHSRFGDLVAWRESNGVYATRVSPFGAEMDGRGIELSSATAGPPRVALTGADYVVAWGEADTVQLRYISPIAGLQPQRVELEAGWDENADRRVGLAVTADATYLAWTRDARVWLVRIPHDTRIPEAVPLAVSPEGMVALNPDIASNGSSLLVAWHEVTDSYGWLCGYSSEAIVGTTWGARVAANMTLLDTAPLRLGDNGDAWPHPISVASNGSDWLLSWLSVEHDPATQRSKSWIVARRILDSGILEGDAPVRVGEGRASSLLWNGSDYAIAWKEDQSPRFLLRLGLIGRTGTPAIRNDVEVAVTESVQDRFGLTSIDGRTAIVYARMSRAPEHGRVERAFLRMFGSAPRRRAVR
jgi:hypothetical protein